LGFPSIGPLLRAARVHGAGAEVRQARLGHDIRSCTYPWQVCWGTKALDKLVDTLNRTIAPRNERTLYDQAVEEDNRFIRVVNECRDLEIDGMPGSTTEAISGRS
jgi:hypothetical protein